MKKNKDTNKFVNKKVTVMTKRSFNRKADDKDFCSGIPVERDCKLKLVNQKEYDKQFEIRYCHIVRESGVDLPTIDEFERKHKVRKFRYLAQLEMSQNFITKDMLSPGDEIIEE